MNQRWTQIYLLQKLFELLEFKSENSMTATKTERHSAHDAVNKQNKYVYNAFN